MAIAFDAAAGDVDADQSASATHALGAGSGTNRLLLLFCFARGNPGTTTFTAYTYNGVTATLLGSITSSPTPGSSFSVRTSIYYLLDAALPAGTGNYTATATASVGVAETGVCAISLTGVDQADPFGASGTWGREAVVDPINDAITTEANDSLVVDGCAADLWTGSGTTTQAGQTERFDDSDASNLTAMASTRPAATAGSWTMGWDFSAGPNRSAHYVVEVLQSAPSGENASLLPSFNF